MTPIPLTETQMAELFRLRAENATLQTEIAELRIRMNAYQQAWNSDELEKSFSVENAALKEQVAQLKSSVQHEADCFDSAAAEINRQASENYKLKETIAQQAKAIRLMDEALEKIECIGNGNSHGNSIGNCLAIDALAIQPSPEILQARDDRVAEACALLCHHEAHVMSAHGDSGVEGANWCGSQIRNGGWKEYL